MFLTVCERASDVDGIGWRIIGGPYFRFSPSPLANAANVLAHGLIIGTRRIDFDRPALYVTFGCVRMDVDGRVETHTVKVGDQVWFLDMWNVPPPPSEPRPRFSGRVMRDLQICVDVEPTMPSTPLAPRRRKGGTWQRPSAAS